MDSAGFSSSADTSLMNDGGKMETIPIESEPGLSAFAEAYISANNARDVQKIRAMTHPKDLAAYDKFLSKMKAAPGEGKPAVKEMLLQDIVPANHPPVIVQRYLNGSPPPQKGFMDWPVPPTHLLQFTYEKSAGNYVIFMFHVARLENRWFLVEGVPSAAFLKQMTGGK